MLSTSQKCLSFPRREILTLLKLMGVLPSMWLRFLPWSVNQICLLSACVFFDTLLALATVMVYMKPKVISWTLPRFYNDNKELFFFLRPPKKYKHPRSLSSFSIHNPFWSVEKWGGESLWWFRSLLAISDVPCRRIGPVVERITFIWICINISSAQKLPPSFISCHPPSTYWISAFIMASLFI